MRTGCHYLISLSVCVFVCVTFVVFTDCESCTRSISTNPGSMEGGEHGLTRRTRFVAHCLEVVAVAGLLCISWCVLGGAGVFIVFVFSIFRTRPTASMRPPCLIYIFTSNEARARERNDRGCFLPLGKKNSSYRGVYRVPLFNLSVGVCECVCV